MLKLEKFAEEKERLNCQLLKMMELKDKYMMECNVIRKDRDALDGRYQELHGQKRVFAVTEKLFVLQKFINYIADIS